MLSVQSAVVREGGDMGMGMESGDAFPDFFDSIDFNDLFLDGDILPDLLSDCSATASDNKPDSSSSSTSSGEKKDDKEKKVTNSHVKKTSTASSKNSGGGGGKRKMKVDWTPELHRRFVQAVEQLGVDKAVPSRILEIMGIDCLTRHNIASHLQKYRSHRKHLVAEAACWSERRQLYKREPTVVGPTMGFPTMQMPLHVWGHPKQSLHYPPHPHRGNALGMPCFPPSLPPPPQCVLPSKESIDAAIEDVMAKPWLPLPLGLKPPCMEDVMGHLISLLPPLHDRQSINLTTSLLVPY